MPGRRPQTERGALSCGNDRKVFTEDKTLMLLARNALPITIEGSLRSSGHPTGLFRPEPGWLLRPPPPRAQPGARPGTRLHTEPAADEEMQTRVGADASGHRHHCPEALTFAGPGSCTSFPGFLGSSPCGRRRPRSQHSTLLLLSRKIRDPRSRSVQSRAGLAVVGPGTELRPEPALRVTLSPRVAAGA